MGRIILFFVLVSIFISINQPSNQSQMVKSTYTIESVIDRISESDLYNLTNQYRKENNLKELKISSALKQSSSDKCLDMAKKDYWSHDSPTKLFQDFIWPHVPSSSKVGENLSFNYKTSQGVINGWKNSSSHNLNMLDDWDNIGINVCIAYNYQGLQQTIIVVQHFSKD